MKSSLKTLMICLLLMFGTSCSVLRSQSLTPSDIDGINYHLQERYRIDGAAMLPSFPDGTIVVVDEKAYEQNLVQRGDVIVFQHPNNPERILFKRIIGLPNEQVQVIDGVVSIDSVQIVESYVEEKATYFFSGLQLGENEYFVLGDNRNDSSDSHNWGPLPSENIIGKVIKICQADSSDACEAITPITYNLEN